MSYKYRIDRERGIILDQRLTAYGTETVLGRALLSF